MMSEHMLLLFLGGSVILSLIIARGASSLKTPLIVGYIVAGAIVGPAVFNLITKEQVDSLNIINLIVLSLIGFGIGGELQIAEIKKLGKTIIMIVLLEALGAFVLVSVASSLLLKNIPLGIIFGALASATAPAGTVEVIKQYKAKGSMTTTLYAVMAFDDILALILYSISFPVAMIFMDSPNSVDIGIGTALLHAGKDLWISHPYRWCCRLYSHLCIQVCKEQTQYPADFSSCNTGELRSVRTAGHLPYYAQHGYGYSFGEQRKIDSFKGLHHSWRMVSPNVYLVLCTYRCTPELETYT